MRPERGTAGGPHEDEPLVVGVFYPPSFHSSGAVPDAELERLRALDPRIQVVVQAYADDSALRTRRSTPGFERGDSDLTPLTEAQRAALAQVEVALVLDLPFDTPAVAPRLRWVQAVGTGIGQLATAGLQGNGIRLTNASGTSAPEIAEFVLARVLEHLKRLPEIAAAQAAADWRPRYGRGLSGTTIGLVGLGGINSAVAALARALGMRVLASRRTHDVPHPDVDALYHPDRLDEMVASCDVVVSAVPETPATVGLFDTRIFAAMRTGSLFCNVGRGTAVVDADLLAALDAGRPGAAALDVFNEEPLPADHPYWTHPGVRVSAHCSSVPDTSIARVHELFRDNVGRYLAGRPLLNEVPPDLLA